METTIKVGGMHCDGCDSSIARAVERIDGVTEVSADHRTGTVVVQSAGEIARDDLERAILDAGYDVLPDGTTPLPMA